MYAISMHLDYNVEEFQPPCWVKNVLEPGRPTNLPTAYIEALSVCAGGAQDLINTFLRTESQVLGHLPTVTYVRMTYAITVLVKMSIAAKSTTSGIGRFIDPEGLQIDEYLAKLVSHIRTAVGENKKWVITVFLAVVWRLKSWYRQEDRAELCPSCYLINVDGDSDV